MLTNIQTNDLDNIRFPKVVVVIVGLYAFFWFSYVDLEIITLNNGLHGKRETKIF